MSKPPQSSSMTSPIKKFDIPHVDTSDTTLVKLDKIKGIMTKKQCIIN